MPGLVVLRRIGWTLAAGLAVTAAGLVAALAAPASESQLQDFLRRAVDAHIRPVHTDFATRTGELLAATTALCATPGPEARAAVDVAFKGAVLAASALETVRIGPIASDNRRERIDFWPDARGRGLAQTQKVLAAEDPRDLDVTVLAAKSVAVQGLPAFEFLLYGTGSDAIVEAGSFRCAFARAIAQNLAGMGAAMADGWKGDDGAAALLLAPGPKNPLFRDASEAAGQLVGDMATAMEILADQKLKAILGDDPGKVEAEAGAMVAQREYLRILRGDRGGDPPSLRRCRCRGTCSDLRIAGSPFRWTSRPAMRRG